jgi:Zn-dependent protease with chaperone function
MADGALTPAGAASGGAARKGIVGAYDRLLAWRLPGLPDNAEGVPMGTLQWLLASCLRMPFGTMAALLTAWTGLIVALWVGAVSAIGSIVVTAFGISVSGHLAGIASFTSRTSGGIVFLSALIAGAIGFGTGFSATYASSLFGGLSVVAAALFVGIVIGLVFGLLGTVLEPTLLSWRGYRRPSEREWNRHLSNAMQTVVDNMQLRTTPDLRIFDTAIPQAWAYSRTIVISKGLLEGLDAGELAGVLAHEMTHWRRGDGLALRMIWCFAWPVAVCYSVGMFLSGSRYGPQAAGLADDGGVRAAGTPHSDAKSVTRATVSFLGFLGWMLLWPAWLLTRLVVVPATSVDSRNVEAEADAGAADAGLEAGLVRALEKLSAFEQARNAWDAAIVASHPPIELRIEALEERSVTAPGPVEPVTAKRVRAMFGVLVVLAAMAVSPHVPVYHHRHDNWWW